jgi:hypothetical protein
MSEVKADEQRFHFRGVPIVLHAEGPNHPDEPWSECSEKLLDLLQEADAKIERLQKRVDSMRNALEFHRSSSGLWNTVQIRMPLKDFKRVLYGDIT